MPYFNAPARRSTDAAGTSFISRITGVRWVAKVRAAYVEKIAAAVGATHEVVATALRDYGRS